MDCQPSVIAVLIVEGATESKPRTRDVVLSSDFTKRSRTSSSECRARLEKPEGVFNGSRQLGSFQDAMCAQWRPARNVLCDLSRSCTSSPER